MNTEILSALAEPNRLRIVEYLREGPRSVNEIAERIGIRQPQASKHLRVLSEAGIVEVRPVAQQRVYQLQAKPFEEMESWLETFRKVWENRLDALEAYLQEMKREQVEAQDQAEQDHQPIKGQYHDQ
jgi:DNA-binding transcriptional ArsR family regulator